MRPMAAEADAAAEAEAAELSKTQAVAGMMRHWRRSRPAARPWHPLERMGGEEESQMPGNGGAFGAVVGVCAEMSAMAFFAVSGSGYDCIDGLPLRATGESEHCLSPLPTRNPRRCIPDPWKTSLPAALRLQSTPLPAGPKLAPPASLPSRRKQGHRPRSLKPPMMLEPGPQ